MKSVPPIRLGISGCLLGQKVRYDGNHQRDSYITLTLRKYFEFVPVCPEVAIGLGVPRPPIRLVGNPAAPRAVGVADPTLDVTRKLTVYGQRMARTLDDISGYILKSRSPSCGMERVKGLWRVAAFGTAGACTRRRSWHGSRYCRWKRKGGSATPSCATTSSSACSPIAAGRR